MKKIVLIFMVVVAANAATVQFISAPSNVGPYNLNVDGSVLQGVCINADRNVGPPYTWTADWYPVTFFPDAKPYLEADWLALQLALFPEGSWAGISDARWDLFGANFTDAATLGWLHEAELHYGSVNPTTFMILGARDSAVQNFIVQKGDPAPTVTLIPNPEPATWFLVVGAALVGLGMRKMKGGRL